MDKILIAIGGGELREKQTSDIDGQICGLVKKRNEGKRPVALFVGTASHEACPIIIRFIRLIRGFSG